MNPDKRIDEIIAMLDGSVASGVGHVNVDVDELRESGVEIQQGCADCSTHPMACSVPTIHMGIDDDEQN